MTTSLTTLGDRGAQASAEHAAGGETCPVAHDDDVLAVEPRLELLDAIDVDDRRAMNAPERLGIEALFHVLHAFAQQVGVVLRVNLHVVARRFDPVDLLGAHEENAPARFHDQPLGVFPLFVKLLEQRDEARIESAGAITVELPARAIERLLEAGLIEWLEQEVQRV